MIVDMRLRPPLAGWIDTALFRPGARSATWRPDFPRPPSADQRSPELLIREMDDAGVELGVVIGRQSHGKLGSVRMARWPNG